AGPGLGLRLPFSCVAILLCAFGRLRAQVCDCLACCLSLTTYFPIMNRPKDKNRPKGPMSAYSCFVQVIREEHKKKHPGEQIVFSDFSKKCAERWKVMTPKEKKRFEDLAAVDKERFNREMSEYIPPEGMKKGKKRKAPRDPMLPRRAWSAFFFFCDEHRSRVKELNPEYKVADVAKELGRQWETCQDKAKYELLAQQDKQRYEEVRQT
ncbi:Dorsal switch protein 1, partial [Fasciolopsis buskii]